MNLTNKVPDLTPKINFANDIFSLSIMFEKFENFDSVKPNAQDTVEVNHEKEDRNLSGTVSNPSHVINSCWYQKLHK